MLDAVFISDLHLHPQESEINDRFNAFINWAASNTRTLYILGDFFHVWPGDDGFDAWSYGIAKRLAWLAQQQVLIYFMHGNRDFLLGKKFAGISEVKFIPEFTSIYLGEQKVLLAHGDSYCLQDRTHQQFRRFTRNRCFIKLFLMLPLKIRLNLVNKLRQRSQSNKKAVWQMETSVPALVASMKKNQTRTLIHGHIHKPALRKHRYNGVEYKQYVLSDWDDSPQVLCYDNSKGFKFVHIF